MAYDYSPTPQSGTNAFGMVPGSIGAPSPFSDLSSVYPNLSGTNSQVSSAISGQLAGQLAPSTINGIHDSANTWGVAGGMGAGSGLAGDSGLKSLGINAEQLQQQGLTNYNQTIPTMSSTQTLNPQLQTEIAATNATNAAAPNPSQAASYAQSLFNQYLSKMNPQGSGYSIPGGLQMPSSQSFGGGSAGMNNQYQNTAAGMTGQGQSPYQVFGMGNFGSLGSGTGGGFDQGDVFSVF